MNVEEDLRADNFIHNAMLKRCRKCGETYPRTRKYFYKDPTTKDGFNARCILCQKQKNREHYQTRKHNNPKPSNEIKGVKV